jgi:hypothetical protein
MRPSRVTDALRAMRTLNRKRRRQSKIQNPESTFECREATHAADLGIAGR